MPGLASRLWREGVSGRTSVGPAGRGVSDNGPRPAACGPQAEMTSQAKGSQTSYNKPELCHGARGGWGAM